MLMEHIVKEIWSKWFGLSSCILKLCKFSRTWVSQHNDNTAQTSVFVFTESNTH